jgi:hypothetical protein
MFVLLAAVPSLAASKHALLIGISDYASMHAAERGVSGDRLPPLYGNLDCAEDLVRIETVLRKNFDFDPDDKSQITVLDAPQSTTRGAILSALDRLVAETKPGDIVYIHYSGHGAQLPDDSKPTGLDYALVPSDYRSPANPDRVTDWEQATNEISGRTLGAYLVRLDADRPSQIVLTFDSCHSGEPTRGMARKRGKSLDELRQWYLTYTGKEMPIHPRKTGGGAIPADEGLRGFASDLPHIESNYVVLSACDSDELASEYVDGNKTLGKFTYFLSQVFARANSQTTFQQVFDQVGAMFRQDCDDQTPQLDGNAADKTLFGGAGRIPADGIAISVDPSGKLSLQAGQLQDITAGSTFAIYDANSRHFDSDDRIAEGVIPAGGVRLSDSEIDLTAKSRPNLKQSDLNGALAVEINHVYRGSAFTFDTSTLKEVSPEAASAVLSKLASLKIVSTVLTPGKPADFKLAKSVGTAALTLARGDTGTPIAAISELSDPDAQAGAIYAALKKQAQYRYAFALVNPPAGRRSLLTVAIVAAKPVTMDASGMAIYNGDLPKPASGEARLSVGDWFTVEVTNLGDTDYHVAMLDFESDGAVSPVWPRLSYRGTDNIVPAGKTVRLWYEDDVNRIEPFQATTPDPNEYLRIIGTDSYVSYKALESRGDSRGPESPFSDLLGPAVDEGVRGFGESIAPPTAWATATAPLVIVPASGNEAG